ncbi:unnamed protein product [Urochloa humidicola]
MAPFLFATAAPSLLAASLNAAARHLRHGSAGDVGAASCARLERLDGDGVRSRRAGQGATPSRSFLPVHRLLQACSSTWRCLAFHTRV